MKKDILSVKLLWRWPVARLLSILPSIILNFMAIIPIRKRVVGREKLHVEMTTWWNCLFQDLQPVLAEKYKLTCFKNLPKPCLKQVSLYFLARTGWRSWNRQFHHVVIFTSSFSRSTTCYRPSSQQFYAQNVLHVGLLFSLVEHQKVWLFCPFFGKIEKEQSECQSPPASAIKQLAGKYFTHTRCNVTHTEPAPNAFIPTGEMTLF